MESQKRDRMDGTAVVHVFSLLYTSCIAASMLLMASIEVG